MLTGLGLNWNWSQPICAPCYEKRHPGRQPVPLLPDARDWEICVDCGATHRDGIFVHLDPASANFPTRLADA